MQYYFSTSGFYDTNVCYFSLLLLKLYFPGGTDAMLQEVTNYSFSSYFSSSVDLPLIYTPLHTHTPLTLTLI